jgi:alkylation response protein AidB-like acyl-CoA dehydrogenase
MSATAAADRGQVVDEVEAWLEEAWRPEITVGEWWRRLAEAGYARPTWPEGHGGRGVDVRTAREIMRTLAAHHVIAPPSGGVGALLAGPTLLRHGTPDQRDRHLLPIADGRASWCQLFSEPGAGSDLASVAARAELDGDEWVISGQKVWSSSADLADHGLLIARTDLDAPKHQGITHFCLDMDQPGVEVRPLRQMNGTTSFCEVFLTEVRVPVDDVVGDVGAGWAVAQATLQAERAGITDMRSAKGVVPVASGRRAGHLDRPVGEVVDAHRSRTRPPFDGGAVPVPLMLELARTHGAASDPGVRAQLADYHTRVAINRWTNARIAAARGALTGADGPIAKLLMSSICQRSRDLSFDILGAQALLTDGDDPLAATVVRVGLASPGTRIGGGTDEVQRNVIGERALGLPREPGPSSTPFRELARNG